MATTMTTLRGDSASTADRKLAAEAQLRRNLGITDSARERIRTKLIDVAIEDSPIKRDIFQRKKDEQVYLSLTLVM